MPKNDRALLVDIIILQEGASVNYYSFLPCAEYNTFRMYEILQCRQIAWRGVRA